MNWRVSVSAMYDETMADMWEILNLNIFQDHFFERHVKNVFFE